RIQPEIKPAAPRGKESLSRVAVILESNIIILPKVAPALYGNDQPAVFMRRCKHRHIQVGPWARYPHLDLGVNISVKVFILIGSQLTRFNLIAFKAKPQIESPESLMVYRPAAQASVAGFIINPDLIHFRPTIL